MFCCKHQQALCLHLIIFEYTYEQFNNRYCIISKFIFGNKQTQRENNGIRNTGMKNEKALF